MQDLYIGAGEPVACAGFLYWGWENLWRVQDFFIGAVRTCGVCRIFILGVGEPVCVQDWENLCYVPEFFLYGSGG